MRVEKRDGSRERRVLLGMVVDQVVLSSIAPKWDDKLFSSEWANEVGKWCVKYFERYGKPPRQAIEGLYESWSSRHPDKSTAKVVEKFLTELSGEYDGEEINSKYLLDLASEHFTRVKLMRLRDQLDGDLDTGKLSDAEKRVNTYTKVDIGTGAWIDVLNDRSAVRRVFERKSEPLITYPGALGKFFGSTLERDGFVAFMGREKIGKTWWLLDIAWQAMLDRKRVAFFQIGDLSEEQINGRFLTRAIRRPFDADEWPCTVKIPSAMTRSEGEDGKAEIVVEYKEKTFEEPFSEEEGWKAFRKVAENRIKSDNPYLRLQVHPNSTLTVAALRNELKTAERNGWVPDLVVIDYADILAPAPGYSESRDAVNANWKALRAMSQEFHCLVVTATQANAESYRAEGLDMRHYSEDKRKFAHVTGMVGISQTEPEKEQEVMRLNWLVLRERRHSVKRYVYTAGCLAVASPAIRSTF